MPTPKKSLVSILLAVHNGERTLTRCLESICQQTFQEISVVIIDDASNDSTVQKIQTVQSAFPHIPFTIIQNKENLGLTRSLNRGLEIIDTVYTARIDADDWWEPTKLAQQVSFLATHSDYGLVGTAYVNHFGNKNIPVLLPKTNDRIKASIFRRNPFAHSAVVYKTDLVKSVRGYDTNIRYGQDYDLWLRLLPKTKFANIPGFLCHRNAVDTISSRKQKEQMLQCIRTQLTYIKKYQYSMFNYLYILEPLLVALSPQWLRSLKRNLSL